MKTTWNRAFLWKKQHVQRPCDRRAPGPSQEQGRDCGSFPGLEGACEDPGLHFWGDEAMRHSKQLEIGVNRGQTIMVYSPPA